MLGLCTLLFLIDYRFFPHYDFSFTPFFFNLFSVLPRWRAYSYWLIFSSDI